jgi:hypothetical protein
MTETPAANPIVDMARLDQVVIARQLREALVARAERLGLDPASIAAPSPGALIARADDGTLLRVDFRTYQARDLER